MKILEMAKKFNPYNIPIKEYMVVYIDDLPFIYEGLSSNHEELLFSRWIASPNVEEVAKAYSVKVTVNNLIAGTRIENEYGEKVVFQGIFAMEVYHVGTRYMEIDNLQLCIGKQYLMVGHPQIIRERDGSRELIGDFITEVIFRGSVLKDSGNEYDTMLTFDVLSANGILGQFTMKQPKNKTDIPDELKIFEKIKE